MLDERYKVKKLLLLASLLVWHTIALAQDRKSTQTSDLNALKAEVRNLVDDRSKLVQEIVDSLFSFSELGFQEYETQRYLSQILQENGFEVEIGIAGMPSAWWARWGSGKPVISMGSDVDGVPKASQVPGVAYRQPMVEGAPGHGEGHNSGQAVNIVAALAVKELMEREKLQGTIVLWPGVAEEQLAAKAWYVRDGRFEDVDAVLFSHVGNNFRVGWGRPRGTGAVSVEYTFTGVAAHGASNPWRGRSALDAVELMNVAWNYRREHMHPLQRSHYVISNGGDQPNVVPSQATVWYFVREISAQGIRDNFATLDQIAEGAALMTDTSFTRRIVGAAYPQHYNRPIALAMYRNIQAVGLPHWTEDDQAFARAIQKLVGADEISGLAAELEQIEVPLADPVSGGSDDIGDVSWSAPTVLMRFPSNINGLPGHHWSSAMAMATPIAHKGALAGAKVMAMTVLDLLQDDAILADAREYFEGEQLKDEKYIAFITNSDPPAIEKNAGIMSEYRAELEKFYYDPSKYDTYLEQLGVDYPQLTK